MSILFKPKQSTDSVIYTDNNTDILLEYGDLSAEIGDNVNVRLSGSHTTGFYPCTVCYVSSSKICLLGNESLGEYTWKEACDLSWNVVIPSNYMYYNKDRIVKNVKIPTIEDIWYRTAGFKRTEIQLGSHSGKYWTSSAEPSIIVPEDTKTEEEKTFVWIVGAAFGNIYLCNCGDNRYAVVPYITIPLDDEISEV